MRADHTCACAGIHELLGIDNTFVDVHDAVLAAERVVRNFVDGRRGGETRAGADVVGHASVDTLTRDNQRAHIDAPTVDMDIGSSCGVGGVTHPKPPEV